MGEGGLLYMLQHLCISYFTHVKTYIQSYYFQMRMAIMTPSEWLRLLCRDWSLENASIVAGIDERFRQYKSYLKGQMTSQLLCRLTIPADGGGGGGFHDQQMMADPTAQNSIDFWKLMGVDDEFDRQHIISNVERFCSLYNIRGGTQDEPAHLPVPSPPVATTAVAQAEHNMPVIGNNGFFTDALHDPAATAAAAAAASMGNNQCALLFVSSFMNLLMRTNLSINSRLFLLPLQTSASRCKCCSCGRCPNCS